jgi:hypothetical protein
MPLNGIVSYEKPGPSCLLPAVSNGVKPVNPQFAVCCLLKIKLAVMTTMSNLPCEILPEQGALCDISPGCAKHDRAQNIVSGIPFNVTHNWAKVDLPLPESPVNHTSVLRSPFRTCRFAQRTWDWNG